MQKAIITVLFSCLVSIMFAQKQNTCNHISPAFKNKYGRMETYIPDSNTSVKTIQLNFIVFQKNDLLTFFLLLHQIIYFPAIHLHIRKQSPIRLHQTK